MVMCTRTDFPPYHDPLAGNDRGPCSDFAPDTLGDDPRVCTSCYYPEAMHAAPEPATDAREDAVCPTHGPNLYACPEGCAFAAAFPLHPAATLTGGAIPEHEPGAYPRLSCCGGSVALVPAHDATHGDPIVSDGPGWGMAGSDREVIDAEPEHGEALLFLEGRGHDANTATVAELYIVARPIGGDGFRYETGAELTIDDLAQLIFRAASLGEAAATDEERHFAAEAFARARDHITRIVEPVDDPA